MSIDFKCSYYYTIDGDVMTGERMNQIYLQACLNENPNLKNEEEKEFYNNLIQEMQAAEKESGKPIEWVIPSE